MFERIYINVVCNRHYQIMSQKIKYCQENGIISFKGRHFPTISDPQRGLKLREYHSRCEKRQSHLTRLDDNILSLYAKGMTVRDI